MKTWGALVTVVIFVAALVALLNMLPQPPSQSIPHQGPTVTAPESPRPEKSGWTYTKSEDALHAKTLDVFKLEGRYLSAPVHSGTPSLVALCNHDKADQLRLDTGVALSVDDYTSFSVEKRLDGKFARASWYVFDNREALAIPNKEFAQILGAHQFIVGVSTIWGSQAIIQFDLPDSDKLAATCGLRLSAVRP